MSDIVQSGGAQEITLPEGKSIDLDTIRTLFKEINASSSKITKVFKENHLIKFNDIEQLLVKFCQVLEPWKVTNASVVVSLSHSDGSKITFKSFDEFRCYDTNQNNAVTSIELEYKFFKLNEDVNKIDIYEISMAISSRAAMRKVVAESNGVDAHLLRLGSMISGQVEISYTDYLIGKYLLQVVSDWYDSVEKSKGDSITALAGSLADWAPTIFRFVLYVVAASFFWISLYGYMVELDGMAQIAAVLVSFFLVLSVLDRLAFRLGVYFDHYIDRIHPAAALLFNEGDKRVMEEFNEFNRDNVVKSVWLLAANTIGAVFLSLLAAMLLNFLGVR